MTHTETVHLLRLESVFNFTYHNLRHQWMRIDRPVTRSIHLVAVSVSGVQHLLSHQFKCQFKLFHILHIFTYSYICMYIRLYIYMYILHTKLYIPFICPSANHTICYCFLLFQFSLLIIFKNARKVLSVIEKQGISIVLRFLYYSSS